MNQNNNTTYFLWIDCEMTGLDPQKDHILELAYILTDSSCNYLEQNEFIIHHSDNTLESMDPWCADHHSESGLTKAARLSKTTYKDIESHLKKALQKYQAKGTIYLAGNSIWNDRNFLEQHIPSLLKLLHYRLLDISSLKIAFSIWKPKLPLFLKNKHHRALDDIKESISEFIHYKNTI